MNQNSPPEPLDPVNAAIERNSGLIVLALICALACMYFPAFRHFCASLVEAALFIVFGIICFGLAKSLIAGGA
jgi:hypothetical protein